MSLAMTPLTEDEEWPVFELYPNTDGTVRLLRRVEEFPNRAAAVEYMLAVTEELRQRKKMATGIIRGSDPELPERGPKCFFH